MSKANDPTVRLPVPALNSAQLRAFAVPSQSPAPVPSASNQLAAEITRHWRRAQMLSTAVNRTTLLVLLAMMVFAEVIRVAAALHGVPPTGVQLFDLGMYALAAAALSPQFGKRMLWASAAFAVAALVGAIWPRWLLALTGAAVGLSFWQADRLSVRRTQP